MAPTAQTATFTPFVIARSLLADYAEYDDLCHSPDFDGTAIVKHVIVVAAYDHLASAIAAGDLAKAKGLAEVFVSAIPAA
jgi:hypothetical protein